MKKYSKCAHFVDDAAKGPHVRTKSVRLIVADFRGKVKRSTNASDS